MHVFGIEPPVLTTELAFDSPAEGTITCLPEACSAAEESFRATAPDGAIRCYGPDGREVAGPGPAPLPVDFASFSTEEGAVVEQSGSTWYISPLRDEVTDIESLLVPREISDRWESARLTAARVIVRSPDLRIVTTDRDGVVGVWSMQAGLTPASSVAMELDPVERLVPVWAPPGTPRSTLATADVEDQPRARVLDVDTGREVARLDGWGSGPSFASSPVVAAGMVDDATLVTVQATGEIVEHDLRSRASAPREPLELSAAIAIGDIDIGGGRLAFLDGREVVVVRLSDGAVVERFGARGGSCDPLYPFPGEASFLDLDDGGDDLAFVTCPAESSRGSLQIVTGVGNASAKEAVELRYDDPSSVSIADGGQVVVVSSFRGQVGVLKDGTWVEPAELQSERFGGVGYQQGWAATDPSGRSVLTRRDLKGVELWVVDGTHMERVTQVANLFDTAFPTRASFAEPEAHLGLEWPSGAVMTWSFERADLLAQACRELPGTLAEYTVSTGVTAVPCGEQRPST